MSSIVKSLNPQQANAIEYYKNPSSETFGNLRQSLIKAGFSKQYAEKIVKTDKKWLSQNLIETVETIQKAESNLKKIINKEFDLETETKATIEKLKMQIDASKFILKTLAKQKYAEEKEKEQQGNTVINITKYGDRVIEAEVVSDDKSIAI